MLVAPGDNAINVLMMSSIWSYINLSSTQHSKVHSSRIHVYLCSAGSVGYCAFKETLQNGTPGNTLLLESDDLRTIGNINKTTLSSDHCMIIYSPTLLSISDPTDISIPPEVSHITAYTNGVRLPQHIFGTQCRGLGSLDLGNLSKMESPYDGFLLGCTRLSSISLDCLSLVTKIHASFLSGCSGLTLLDMAPLSRVVNVGSSFLEGCSGLTSLDLSALSRLDKIRSNFLKGCTGLKSIDLSPLSNVREVDDCFLAGCTGLTSPLDLHSLSQLVVIPSFFLEGCSGLQTLDLSPLSHVREIWFYFLYKCTGLTTLDLRPLSNVKKIHASFLRNCSSLVSLHYMSSLSHITEIPGSFLSGCSSLASLDLSGLTQATCIKDAAFPFLPNCDAIKIIICPPLCVETPPCGWAVVSSKFSAKTRWMRAKDTFSCTLM